MSVNDKNFIDDRPFPSWARFPDFIGSAGHGEDQIVIDYYKNKKNFDKKLVVDIGAADGITASNSRRLIIEENWEAILIEPMNIFVEFLHKIYCNNSNVKILPFACDKEEKVSSLFINKDQSEIGLSSLIPFGNTIIQEIETKRFSNLVQNKRIDFLSIDAEGKDLDIIQDIDLNIYDIEVICIEHTHAQIADLIKQHLLQNNYELSHVTDWNWIFIKKYI